MTSEEWAVYCRDDSTKPKPVYVETHYPRLLERAISDLRRALTRATLDYLSGESDRDSYVAATQGLMSAHAVRVAQITVEYEQAEQGPPPKSFQAGYWASPDEVMFRRTRSLRPTKVTG